MNRDGLRTWCSVLIDDLLEHDDRMIPLRLSADGAEMGELMKRELLDGISLVPDREVGR
jgi:hypothetical protein